MKDGAPTIAVALGLDAAGRWRPGRRYHYLDAAYAVALGDAGAIPLHVSREAPTEAIVALCDGLLVPGGDDFPPDRPYPPDVRFAPVPPEQLAFDAALLAGCLARGRPVLGICYGMQLLVRHHGGRLLYDIAHDLPDARPHQLAPEARHDVVIDAGSRLARALGRERCPVNSRHHQGVAEPGPGLRVCARADDGTIEAVEAEGTGFGLGVQWHPESLEAEHRARLFGAFVSACRSARP
jgi:putative glutamine amidotransferase